MTHHALGMWSKAMFERFGWMLLHKRDGRRYKVDGFVEDVGHLVKAIKEKRDTTSDPDRRRDLRIMLGNAETLLSDARAILLLR